MPESTTQSGWQRGAHRPTVTRTAYRVRPGVDRASRLPHTAARALTGATAAPHAEATQPDAPSHQRWAPASQSTSAIHQPSRLVRHADRAATTAHDHASQSTRALAQSWIGATPRQAQPVTRWASRLLEGDLRRALPPPPPWEPPWPVDFAPVWMGEAVRELPADISYRDIPTPAYAGRHLTAWGLYPYREAARLDRPTLHHWSRLEVIYGGPGPDEISGPGELTGWEHETDRIVIPRRTFYVRTHSLTVVRLPDRTALPVRSLALYTDASLWAWTLNLELIGAGVETLITPAGSDPVQVEVSLNGAVWVCIIETWGETHRWGSLRTVQAKGRSLSALLGPAYVRPTSYAETETRTMAQLAEQELPYGGGWSMTWETSDWVVPAGAWTYQGLSPIQAIARLGASAGCLVAPGRADQSLRVRPVYRVLPWSVTPGSEDLLVPPAAITEITRQYRWPDQANAVHVHGGEVGGVQVLVSRSGSAGDEFAADRSDALCTTSDGGSALGARVLAALATPPSVSSITMPLDARDEFDVPTLGDLARVDIDGGQSGPVTSIRVTAQPQGDAMRVRQTLGLGEASNDYQRLLQLVPNEPRILAQVSAIYTSGTATVTLLSGATMRVRHRGIGAQDNWVWVRAGQIEAVAPSLPAYSATV